MVEACTEVHLQQPVIMWQITWIHYSGDVAKIGSVTSPNAQTMWTVFYAMISQGWNVRIWNPNKELAA